MKCSLKCKKLKVHSIQNIYQERILLLLKNAYTLTSNKSYRENYYQYKDVVF